MITSAADLGCDWLMITDLALGIPDCVSEHALRPLLLSIFE